MKSQEFSQSLASSVLVPYRALQEQVPTQKESPPRSTGAVHHALQKQVPIQKESTMSLTLVKPSHDNEYSRILTAVKQGKSPRIKYRSPASMRSKSQRQEWRSQHLVNLDICEIGARPFARLVRSDEQAAFSLSLIEIDRFLEVPQGDSVPTLNVSKNTNFQSPRPRFSPDPARCAADQAHNRALFQIKKQLHLASAVTQDKLQAYRDRKNVDPATILPRYYHEFLNVFSRKNADTLPPHRPYDHAIKLKENLQPPSTALYGMSRDKILKLRRYLDDNLAKGFIRASRSHAASPVLFIKKPEEDLRFCVNYRGLNSVTVKNRYPLPLISETLNRLSYAKVFTKLDIISAFKRLRIREGDEELTVFRTRFGLFEYLVMSFGLCNGPASFQHYINDTLREYLNDICTAYLDDILVYSDLVEEHEIHVKRILRKLREAGLQADITKCEFHVSEVAYLGLIVTTTGIKMNPKKVDTVLNWPPLTDVKDIQSFLGFANFYRRFIYDFSKLAAPLTAMTRKNTEFRWDSACQSSFEALKKAFTSDTVLIHYHPDRKLVVETDASDYVSEGILSQYNDNDVLRPVAYFSKKHNPAEYNYEIYDKELMAIVRISRTGG